MNLLSLTLAGMTSFGMFANHNTMETSPMFPEAPVLQKHSIKGSEDKEYVCYDVEHGYSIYLKTANGLVFCEGSYQSNSPYYLHDTKGEDLYYFGLGNYFAGSENRAKSLLNQAVISPKNILEQSKRQLGSLDIYPVMVYTSSSQTEENFLYDDGIEPKAEGDM